MRRAQSADNRLPAAEFRAQWLPRIGPAATTLRLRCRTAGRVAVTAWICWLVALSVALTSDSDAIGWPALVLAIVGLPVAWVAVFLSIRWSRRAQRAANAFWGLPDNAHPGAPFDDLRRFEAWRARHPDRQPQQS